MGRRWSACFCIVTVSQPKHLQLHSPSRRVLGGTSCVPRGQVASGGTEARRGHQGAVAPGGGMDGGLDTARDLLCLALGAPCLMLSAGLSISPGWGSALSVSQGIFERPFRFCQSHSTGGETEAQKPDRGWGGCGWSRGLASKVLPSPAGSLEAGGHGQAPAPGSGSDSPKKELRVPSLPRLSTEAAPP